MTDLTATQLEDFRTDIADTGTPPAFTDAELQRLYARAGEIYNRAILLSIDQLIVSAAKFADYTQNQSAEKKSQVIAHLLKVRDIWQMRSDSDTASAQTTTRIVPLKVTRRSKEFPDDGYNYRRNNARSNELDDDSG